jgi:hypothetical protein
MPKTEKKSKYLSRLVPIAAILLMVPPALLAQGCGGGSIAPNTELQFLEHGYCFEGYWIPGLVSRRTYNAIPPTYFQGRALYQERGVMEETARIKGYDGTEHYIALLPPVTAGWGGFIQMPGSSDWIPVRVVDVVKREHYYFQAMYNHAAMELSYTLAEQLGVIDMFTPHMGKFAWGVKFCATDHDPAAACQGEPPLFEDWFKDNLSFGTA